MRKQIHSNKCKFCQKNVVVYGFEPSELCDKCKKIYVRPK